MTVPRERPLDCWAGCFQLSRNDATERELKSALRLDDGDCWFVADDTARRVGSFYKLAERFVVIAIVHRDQAEPLVFEIVSGFVAAVVVAGFEDEQRQHCREYSKRT